MPDHHQIGFAGVMEGEAGRHGNRNQRRFVDGYFQPYHQQLLGLPGVQGLPEGRLELARIIRQGSGIYDYATKLVGGSFQQGH